MPRTQSAPSSRWGRNSEPITPPRVRKIATSKPATATPTVTNTMLNSPSRSFAIPRLQEFHHRIAPFVYALPEEKTRQYRRNENRKYDGTEKCERDSPGHRLEEAPLDALQSENGQVRCDDDGDCVKHRTLDFMRGLPDHFNCRSSKCFRFDAG